MTTTNPLDPFSWTSVLAIGLEGRGSHRVGGNIGPMVQLPAEAHDRRAGAHPVAAAHDAPCNRAGHNLAGTRPRKPEKIGFTKNALSNALRRVALIQSMKRRPAPCTKHITPISSSHQKG
jgi:hypothetical protein